MRKINNIELIEKILEENKVDIKDMLLFYSFWKRVDIRDNIEECWNWSTCIHHTGYGIYNNESAHRLAYMMSKGSIPNGLQVQHICNNRKCCNPNHLELGDNSKNMRYMIKCGRGNIAKGENHTNAKLTEDDVKKIHKIYKEHPRLKQWQIAKMFKIEQSTLSAIIRGETWRHIYELNDNSKDALHRIKYGPTGESNGNSILTDDQVRSIYKIHKENPRLKQWQIAEMFKVSQCTVSAIITGKNWRHINK